MNRIARYIGWGLISLWMPLALWAGEDDVGVFVDSALEQSGIMQFLQPRFSLKTGVRIAHLATPNGADVLLSDQNAPDRVPVMAREGVVYFVIQANAGSPASRFVDWLLSDIGQRTIEQFKPKTGQPFSGAAGMVAEVVEITLQGDVAKGETLSYRNCGRCHVIGEQNRMKGIGSTPSFALLRTFPDWQNRFEGFYALNPHPSFSQITGITAPFDPMRPPPINPLVLSIKQLEDILAFVGTIEPADLGAALEHQ